MSSSLDLQLFSLASICVQFKNIYEINNNYVMSKPNELSGSNLVEKWKITVK
jgi:hypothetical protein